MNEKAIKEEFDLIKKELTDIKALLNRSNEYREKYPIERLLDLEYLFREYLMRIEQRLF